MTFSESDDLKVPILSCTLCSYYKPTRKKNAIGFCKKMNFYLYRNFAPLCLAFTVEQQVRVIDALIASPPAGKNVTKLEFSRDANGYIETIVFKQDTETLFTLTVERDANNRIESIERS